VKLTRLKLDNFGPYFGGHALDLQVTPSSRVVLIHGENERGKTTLVNAIRWCLYLRAAGRGGQPLPAYRLMNNEAKESGLFNMSVTLEFEHAGATYVLDRHAQSHRIPTDDGHLQIRSTLRKNGNIEPEGAIGRVVGNILHPDISRFFLFDGEMLNEYEDLLRDEYRRAQVVKQSIEQILGLPSIQRSVGTLDELRRTVEKSQMREAKARRANEQLIADAQQKEEALEALNRDIQTNTDIRKTLEVERDDLRRQLEQFGEIRADLRDIDRHEKEIRDLDEASKEARKEIQALLKDSWWMPLERAAEQHSREAEIKAATAAANAGLRQQLRQTLSDLEAALQANRCSLCGHAISSSEVSLFTERRGQIREQLDTLSLDDAAKHLETLAQLRPFVGLNAYSVLREKETTFRRAAIRKRQIQSEIEKIRERVRTDYRAEIADVERKLEKCLLHLGDVERLLRDAEQRRDETDAALQRLQTQIRKLPSANKRLAIEADLYGRLGRLFSLAVDEFRQRMRVDVEKVASDIHRNLTAEPGYAGLKINEQYGLSLINERGRTVVDRSAGSEQIVALSLIGALNRCATREGPIVMDTPFGRLDRRHRKNILKYAPQFGPQVILLVQSGELERDRDLGDIAPFLVREYRIERDGSSDRSRIVELTS
jgi:DNA sulfur modification protein DndD